jgi:hypothetical protein
MFAALCANGLAPAAARAQDVPGAATGDRAAVADAGGAGLVRESPGAGQEIGPQLGLRIGGRSTPGGLGVGATFLYRLSDELWSDTQFGASIGGGGAQCFRNRADAVVCDHGQLDGLGFGVIAGLRWYARPQQGFYPYLRAGLGAELVRFGDDGLWGVGVPLGLGAGVRSRVTDAIAVGAGADLQLGVARFDRGVGLEPQAALLVRAAVELAL